MLGFPGRVAHVLAPAASNGDTRHNDFSGVDAASRHG